MREVLAGRAEASYRNVQGSEPRPAMLKLSLIGMSGTGKTYWSRKLAAAGFLAIRVDDRIEKMLASDLAAGRHRGIGGVAAWMGWPDRPQYRQREQKYLACEIEVMREALDEIEAAEPEGIVLDTTGSVVYSGDEICRRLQKLTRVVYLEASPAEEATLIAHYLADPKPVLWSDQFAARNGESAQAAIARCYPKLIAQRRALYERYAHRRIPMSSLRDAGLDARGFVERIEAQARPAAR